MEGRIKPSRCPSASEILSNRSDRLQFGPTAAEHRIDRKLAKELEDLGEKRVVRSEHHSRADEKCISERGADRQFAFAALSDVAGC